MSPEKLLCTIVHFVRFLRKQVSTNIGSGTLDSLPRQENIPPRPRPYYSNTELLQLREVWPPPKIKSEIEMLLTTALLCNKDIAKDSQSLLLGRPYAKKDTAKNKK